MSSNTRAAGRYRHYKGGEYEVIDEAVHTETVERLIVYRSLHGPYAVWVRPYDMFFEVVTVDGQDVPRFERMDM